MEDLARNLGKRPFFIAPQFPKSRAFCSQKDGEQISDAPTSNPINGTAVDFVIRRRAQVEPGRAVIIAL
jgi:hypothetical protein